MNRDTVTRLVNSRQDAIDFNSPGAAMRLAWRWLGQELWAARRFDMPADEVRFYFSYHLGKAWEHVHFVRRNQAQRERAETLHAERLAELRAQRAALQNKPFAISIMPEIGRIDREIQEIMTNA